MSLYSKGFIGKVSFILLNILIIFNLPAEASSPSFCIAEPSTNEKDSLIYNVVINTYIASAKDVEDPESIWDKSFIKKDPELALALEEYKTNKRGHMVKKLRVAGLNAKQIHDILLKQGFEHERKPLHIPKNHNIYWLKDGTITNDENHKNIVPIDIYIHKDGSMVRVKPFGIPDKQAKVFRREAHISKAVLKILPCDCINRECKYDTSFQNEAFKVSELGYPLPKRPSLKAGLKLPYNNSTYLGRKLNAVVSTTVSNLGHIRLATDCPSIESYMLNDNKEYTNEKGNAN